MSNDFFDCLTEAKRFFAKAEQFSGCKEALTQQLGESDHKEYARGGETLIRGFYHPSPLGDIVVGNSGRGSLSKSFSPKTTSYVYYFDASGRIMRIESVYHGTVWATEYILNSEAESTGILFDADGNVTRIAEERYTENKLTAWSAFHIHADGWELENDQYHYQNGKLTQLTQHHCIKIACPSTFASVGLTHILPLPEDGIIHQIIEYQDFEIVDSCVIAFSLTSTGAHGPRPTQNVSLPKPKPFSYSPARSHWK